MISLRNTAKIIGNHEKNSEIPPTILEIEGVKSFITAYAALSDGTLLIGENACYARGAQKRKLRFKSRFLKDSSVEQDVKSFAAGVLGALYASGDLLRNDEDSCFYVGCPAGWDLNDRERYRGIFERAGRGLTLPARLFLSAASPFCRCSRQGNQ